MTASTFFDMLLVPQAHDGVGEAPVAGLCEEPANVRLHGVLCRGATLGEVPSQHACRGEEKDVSFRLREPVPHAPDGDGACARRFRVIADLLRRHWLGSCAPIGPEARWLRAMCHWLSLFLSRHRSVVPVPPESGHANEHFLDVENFSMSEKREGCTLTCGSTPRGDDGCQL
jgi:hypothetical protein